MFRLLTLALVLGCAAAAPAVDDELPVLGIVGGTSVDISSVPYQVSLQYRGSHMCGGSILNSRTVITAAHCVHGMHAGLFTIRVGSSRRGSGGQTYQVIAAVPHSRYNPTTYDNDIAILKLADDIKFSHVVQPIELPKAYEEIAYGEYGAVTGWGALSENGAIATTLQFLHVAFLAENTCTRLYPGKLTHNMFCAGYLTAGRDSCQGDSGGPLAYSGKLVGVVSWGYGCARQNLPGVYTKVSNYISWIKQNSA